MMRGLIQFVGERESLKHNFDLSEIMNRNPKPSDYIWFRAVSPSEYEGKGILVFHSQEDGMLPKASKDALERHGQDTDLIYCCYPFNTRRRMRDDRITMHQECEIYFDLKIKGEFVMIALMEKIRNLR